MKQWIIDAIHKGHGVCYIDPHGHDTDELLHYIPRARRTATTIFDPTRFPIAWNPLTGSNVPLIATSFVDTFRITSGYTNIATPRLDALIYNAVYGLVEAKEGLFGLYLMLVSGAYRTHVLEAVTNPVVVSFWRWYEALSEKRREEFTESTFTKVQALMADPRIMAITGKDNRLDLSAVAADGLLFLRLPQGEMGLGKTSLIGSLFLSQLHQLLLARNTAVPFELYVDEAHNFAPQSLVEMLSGIRKANVSVTICHQYMSQLDIHLLASLRANADTFAFRSSLEDVRYFPELGQGNIATNELFPFQYWHMADGRPQLRTSEPISVDSYPASARQVLANVQRNLVADATAENISLMGRFLQ